MPLNWRPNPIAKKMASGSIAAPWESRISIGLGSGSFAADASGVERRKQDPGRRLDIVFGSAPCSSSQVSSASFPSAELVSGQAHELIIHILDLLNSRVFKRSRVDVPPRIDQQLEYCGLAPLESISAGQRIQLGSMLEEQLDCLK